EPDEGPAPPAGVVADRATQHRVPGFELVEHGLLGDRARYLKLHLTVYPRQRPQMGGEHHPDHRRVCTSTDSTAGRSRTIGAQLSPESAEAYTWPPVVPK